MFADKERDLLIGAQPPLLEKEGIGGAIQLPISTTILDSFAAAGLTMELESLLLFIASGFLILRT